MKYLQEAIFDIINNALVFNAGDCKNGRAERKLYKKIESRLADDNSATLTCPEPKTELAPSASMALSASPDVHTLTNIVSPFGPLSEARSRKTLFYLIATLNASFPDYDFSDARPEQFCKQQNVTSIVSTINNTLFSVGAKRIVEQMRLWEAIDARITLAECEIYSYLPDMDSDPYGEEGSIWSFNYFFYNKKQKKMLFFTVNALSQSAPLQEDEDCEAYNTDSSIEDYAAYEDFVMNTLEV